MLCAVNELICNCGSRTFLVSQVFVMVEIDELEEGIGQAGIRKIYTCSVCKGSKDHNFTQNDIQEIKL